MSQFPQSLHRVLADPFFNIDSPIKLLSKLGIARRNADTRCVQGRLRVVSKCKHIEKDLDVALRLHEPAHDAVDGVQRAVGRVRDHRRDDGVVGSLAGGKDIGMIRGKREIGAAVLQCKAASLGDNAGSEPCVVGIDERDSVAGAVGYRKVHCVAVVVRGTAMVEDIGCGARVEDLGAFRKVGRREEFFCWDGRCVWVRDEPGGVCESDAQGLDDGMEVLGAVMLFLGEGRDFAGLLKFLENAQRHECYNPLTVRWVLPDLDALVSFAVCAGCLFVRYVLPAELERDGFSLLRATFPAGTVSGAPKVRAMEIIEELEGVRRAAYAGAVGYIDYDGTMDTCITLRTITMRGDTCYLQAGGGIVADSDPTYEYNESLHKARALAVAVEHAERGM